MFLTFCIFFIKIAKNVGFHPWPGSRPVTLTCIIIKRCQNKSESTLLVCTVALLLLLNRLTQNRNLVSWFLFNFKWWNLTFVSSSQ